MEDYENYTKKKLIQIAKKKGQLTSGNKLDLIDRLESYDKERRPTPYKKLNQKEYDRQIAGPYARRGPRGPVAPSHAESAPNFFINWGQYLLIYFITILFFAYNPFWLLETDAETRSIVEQYIYSESLNYVMRTALYNCGN